MSQFDPRPQQYGEYQPPQQFGQNPTQSNGKATASFVLGLLSLCLTVLAGLPAIILGVMALSSVSRGRGRVGGQGLAIAGIVLGGIGTAMTLVQVALLLPAVMAAREAARRSVSMQNLRVIGRGLDDHHSSRLNLPPAFSVDGNGKPLLSWRVHILPFIGHESLYKEFKLDEPWDSTHNKRLINQMPDAFRSPSAQTGANETVYLAVVGPRQTDIATAFDDSGRGISYAAITDGTSNTITVVEANEDQAVIWTKPGDWNFDPRNPRRGLFELRPRGFLALSGDGSVRFISASVDDENLRNLFCRNDGNLASY